MSYSSSVNLEMWAGLTITEDRTEIADWGMECGMAVTKPGFIQNTQSLPQKLPLYSNVLQFYLDIQTQTPFLWSILSKISTEH